MRGGVVIVNLAEFERAVEAFATDIERGCIGVVQQTCLDGAEHARAVGQFQDRTGALRASIHAFPTVRIERGAKGSFGTTKSYAAIVEGGSRAHEIRARRRAALRWEDAGGVHFARVVQHPGTKPLPFMGPGAIKAEQALHARTAVMVANAIRRAS